MASIIYPNPLMGHRETRTDEELEIHFNNMKRIEKEREEAIKQEIKTMANEELEALLRSIDKEVKNTETQRLLRLINDEFSDRLDEELKILSVELNEK